MIRSFADAATEALFQGSRAGSWRRIPADVRAAALLGPGRLRAQADYWAGLLAGPTDPGRQAWRRSGESEAGGPWGRLARSELDVARVREAVGPLAVP